VEKIREQTLKKVENFILEKEMLKAGEKILLGVSGGADSVCLLCILEELAAKMNFSIGVLHIEHGIRGEASLRDAAFVRALCEKKRIPFEERSFPIPEIAEREGLSEEETGRKMRYQAFSEKMEQENYQKTAIAHNLNDNAETMLFHLARGSALAGLAGIAAVRGQFIRPLLCLERKEIEAYLKAIGQEYCSDQTNEDLYYSRNRIRHSLLPELEKINPKTIEHMGRTASFLRQADQYLTGVAKQLEEKAVLRKEANEVRLRIRTLQEAEPLLRSYLFMEIMESVGGHRVDLGEKHLQDLEKLLESQSGKNIDLPYGMKAIRSYDELIIRRGKEKLSAEAWELEMSPIEIENVDFQRITEEKAYTKYIDYDKMDSKPVLRTRQPGDYLILDKSGHKKSLRRYFIDQKIPAEERERKMLLADGSRIIWILGDRLSYDFYLTEKTKHILKIEAKKKDKEVRQ
jgi:tRNA(Ile)-lysidine synthase